MRQITLLMDDTQKRPVIQISNGLTALLDTGAYIPVWVDDEKILTDVFGATLQKRDVAFTGFGGTAIGNLYKVTFQIGDLIYPNMVIIANDDLKVPFNLILSATMFQNLIYEVDDKNHRLNITVPDEESLIRNLRIVDKEENLHVLCDSLWDDESKTSGIISQRHC